MKINEHDMLFCVVIPLGIRFHSDWVDPYDTPELYETIVQKGEDPYDQNPQAVEWYLRFSSRRLER